MKNKKIQNFFFITLMLIFFAFPSSTITQEAEKIQNEQSISYWLVLESFATPLPTFHKDNKKGFSLKDLLEFEEFDISRLWPKVNKPFKLHDGTSAKWKTVEAGKRGIMFTEIPPGPATAYLGVYLDVSRWTKAKVTLTSPQLFKVYLDGRVLVTKDKSDKTQEGKTSNEGTKKSADIALETGKHLLLVKTLYDPESSSDWTVQGKIARDAKFSSPVPALTLSSEQKMTIKHLLDGPKVTGASISPDGTLAALTKRQTLPPSNRSEAWVELYEVEGSRLIQTFRGDMAISRVNWAPEGKKFSYTSYSESGGTIWIVDLEAGTSFPLLKKVQDLGGHTWAPDGSFIIYSIREKGKPDRNGVKRFQNMADRQPGWRDRSYLYKITVPDGVRQRLTAGKLSTYLNSISPDGKKLLFTRLIVDYSERPYSLTELYSLDLTTLKAERLWKGKWFRNASWGPKGKKLLVLGGPSTFGDAGVNVTNGTIPNEYDTQAFLFDLASKKVDPISKSFNPTINQAYWSQLKGNIYLTATNRTYNQFFIYDLKKKIFSRIDCGVDVLGQIDIADKKPLAVYIGSSAASPPKAYVLNIQKRKWEVLHDPGKEDYAEVKFGEIKRWTFKNKRGRDIEGRIYFPPDFNPSKKYPCIVYYYGGTSPVTRSFGGRYPFNLYTAHGYVVYVLQPSGAIGFGQEFSALHVNDWGLIVADEIINGVKKFLNAHSFVDHKRVGCMGASYGGFMTMLLLTRTNVFCAAIAHAGISSISSYWGEGYWGYSYSALATANSFPWNRKDIYVSQSALFHADKISTPLLLLHGSVDTNVPPGESTQLFTALKLLGRDVEYIQILDQNHHIMTYNKRITWTKTILAWFDKWLKSEGEWWVTLYPNL